MLLKACRKRRRRVESGTAGVHQDFKGRSYLVSWSLGLGVIFPPLLRLNSDTAPCCDVPMRHIREGSPNGRYLGNIFRFLSV